MKATGYVCCPEFLKRSWQANDLADRHAQEMPYTISAASYIHWSDRVTETAALVALQRRERPRRRDSH